MTDANPEGHDADAGEDGDDYLDRLFSREKVWSVVIGFGMTNVLLHAVAIVWPGIPVGTHDDWLLGWLLLTPALVLGGLKWPDFERRYASVLPWMDDDLGRGEN